MTSQAHLSVVPAYPVPPRRKPHNTNRGRKFPPEPITPEEFARMLAQCVPLREGRHHELSALRLRTTLVILYRAGLRINELLMLHEHDLRRDEKAIFIRMGKGAKQRLVCMDDWAWREVDYWLTVRPEIPPGALLPVLRGATAGRPMKAPDVRRAMKSVRDRAGLHRRVHPHAFRHGFAVEASREGIPLYSLQGQLGHARLDVTERYLRGIDPMERLAPFAERRAPMIPVESIHSAHLSEACQTSALAPHGR